MNIQVPKATTHMVDPLLMEIAPENPRSNETVDADAVLALAESIQAIGVLTPLIAYEDGDTFQVTAGGRRLRALHSLIKNKLFEGHVPVSVMQKDMAVSAGHAEQLTHQIMSDLDTLRVFDHPIYKKWSDARLAHLTGRTESYVKQRRAILDLDQSVVEALFAGEITVGQAAGLVYWKDDEEGTAEWLERCKNSKHYDGNDLRTAFERHCSTWDKSRWTGNITVEEYLGAGGKLQADLFADDQFILSPDIARRLAFDKARAEAEATYPGRNEYIAVEDYISGSQLHHGLPCAATEEEEDEFYDLSSTFPNWLTEEGIQERIADPEEEDATKENLKRFKELQPKVEPQFPDELLAMLNVGYSINYGGKVKLWNNILPDDLTPLYDAGFLDRPEEVEEEALEGTVDAPKTQIEVSLTHADQIMRIKRHVVQQVMISKPHEVFSEFLVHLTVPSYNVSHFNYRPEHDDHLTESDPMPNYSKAWEAAMELDGKEEDHIRGLKAADINKLMAYRLLLCVSRRALPFKVDAKQLRDYINLDAAFFKKYKKPVLIKMLGVLSDRDFENAKVATMAEELEKLYREQPSWLPIGF